MQIPRDRYLNALIERKHNGLVKVVTGMRRCGKSYLLFRLFRDHLRESGVPDDHVIAVQLDLRSARSLRDPDALLEFVHGKIKDAGTHYVLLDEVQLLPDFVEVLNELLANPSVDAYVTGSNSRFLSKDIITEFRGRGDEVHVFPLSFAEFMQVRSDGPLRAWADYVEYGGLPLVATMPSEEQKAAYLSRLFEETYIKDIVERNGLRKTQELEDLVDVLASAVGSLTNASKIQATFKSTLHSSISTATVRSYIDCLEDAFLVSEAKRYDIKGRKYIGAPAKYYFEDVGLRNARLNFRQVEETHLMENVVYNELRARGLSVDVGIVTRRRLDSEGRKVASNLEVDFVANRGSRRYYIQSAYAMPSAAKREQEAASLRRIDDSFKKIIVVKDVVNTTRDESGIVTMGLFDFLLDPASLDR
ncbi:MAG: ATP-binding protein [Coriobacteriales bacterium]